MISSDTAKPSANCRELTARLLRTGLCPPVSDPCRQDEFEDRWPEVATYACRNGLAGLVLKAARTVCLSVPPACEETLRVAAAEVAARNFNIESQFARIAAGFNEANVDLLALKGVVLSRQVYRRCDLRFMADVDLMVRPNDVGRGCRLFEKLGCSRGEDLVRPDFFPRFYNEVEYLTHGLCPVKFDIHVRPFRSAMYRRTIPDEGLWEKCQRMSVAEASWVYAPSAERMLIHLCCHAACHGADRLLWLLDIKLFAATIEHAMDWDGFCKTTERWRLGWPVQQALNETEAAFGQAVPDHVRAQLAAMPAGWRDRLTVWHAPRDATHPIGHLLVDTFCGAGAGDRLRYLRAVAFPQRSHMGTLYPWRHPGWEVAAHAYRLLRLPFKKRDRSN